MAWSSPKTWVTDELVDATDMNTEIRDNLIAVLPIATLILRAAAYTTVETAVESRWLQCNGVAVSRTTYSLLFNYLNSLSPALPFGSGNGTTTFNIPDMGGRIPVAEGEHADVDSMGESDGAAIANRRPKHYHLSQYGTTSTGGTIPVMATFDSTITNTYPTTPGSTDNIQDTPAFLVVGSWFIKYV
jgi:microcystin-dependent protein